MDTSTISAPRSPWNKDKLVGQKRPFKLKEFWAIRTRLQLSCRTRDLALFNLGIDSKLRACDLVKLRVRDVANGDRPAARANVIQQKTGRPVQFELTEPTRLAVSGWIHLAHFVPKTSSSRAGFMLRHTLGHGSTRASSTAGWGRSAWTRPTTAPIRCAGPRLPWSTAAPRTSVRCSFCSGTPSWKAPCVT